MKCWLVCQDVCFKIYVETAEPIGPTFYFATYMTVGKVMDGQNYFFSKSNNFDRKIREN